MAHDVDEALAKHDLFLFYKQLKRLGVHIFGKTRAGEERHTLDEVTDFLTDLGSNPAAVEETTIMAGQLRRLGWRTCLRGRRWPSSTSG